MKNDDMPLHSSPDEESAVPTPVLLARIAADVELLGHVLSGYPQRHPEVWRSAGWAKDLKDLELACTRLRKRARQLEELSDRIRRHAQDAG